LAVGEQQDAGLGFNWPRVGGRWRRSKREKGKEEGKEEGDALQGCEWSPLSICKHMIVAAGIEL